MNKKYVLFIIGLIAIVSTVSIVFAEENVPPAMPGGDMGMGASTQNLNLTAVLEVIAKTLNEVSKTYTATESDQSCVLVKDNGNLTLSGATLDKSGDSSNTENSNFYGLNAAAVVQDGLLKVTGNGFWIFSTPTKIKTNAEGANGLFATGNNSVIEADNVEINTEKNSARGLDATYGGTIKGNNIKITTQGEHCAAVATDRGEGNIDIKNSQLNTNGKGSPSIYSTGNIKVVDSKGIATASSAAVIEGKNLIDLTNCQFTTHAYGRTESGIDSAAVMIYQSMSGDASEGTGTFNAKDTSITVDSSSKTYKTAPLFFVTNTNAEINLDNAKFEYGSDLLLNASGNSGEWGNAGSNGGNVKFTLNNGDIAGKIIVDSISSLELFVNGGSLTTAINSEHNNGTVNVNLASGANLKLTGDCYVSSFTDEKADFSNIESQGHNIYYDSSKCPHLNGQTFNLNGGGKLLPM